MRENEMPLPATPRTDAEAKDDFMFNHDSGEVYVNADFARKLERELAGQKVVNFSTTLDGVKGLLDETTCKLTAVQLAYNEADAHRKSLDAQLREYHAKLDAALEQLEEESMQRSHLQSQLDEANAKLAKLENPTPIEDQLM